MGLVLDDALDHLYALPTIGANGSTIEWDIDSNHEDNLVNGALYNNTNNDINVILYATFMCGDATAYQQYEVTILCSGQEDNSSDYYASVSNLSGNALKSSLRTLLTDTHKYQTSYGDCKVYLQETDVDPNDPTKVILFYTGNSVNGTWDSGKTWNREHVWAQSLSWFDDTSESDRGAGADLHHIRPCDPGVNSSRGNLLFGESNGYFNPNIYGVDYRGDVARIIFYLMVRYSDSDGYDWNSIAESYDVLIKWHLADEVDSFEISRNDKIYSIQGNRNPFIDHPEYAKTIWG